MGNCALRRQSVLPFKLGLTNFVSVSIFLV